MNGTIALCPYQGCEYRCCRFDQGNYIVLHPGELRAAQSRVCRRLIYRSSTTATTAARRQSARPWSR